MKTPDDVVEKIGTGIVSKPRTRCLHIAELEKFVPASDRACWTN